MAPKNITAFSFSSPSATGAISGTKITVTVPVATDVTALIATFTHTGDSVNIDGTAQTSGVTANDFTDDVTYTVVATDATEQDYTVTVTVSKVTVAQIAALRRMVAEPTTTTYSDALLINFIEAYPHLDEQGELPYTLSSATPPAQTPNDNWIPTYDLHAAAGDVWEEKASTIVHKFDFSADGGSYSASKQYEQYMAQARYHRSRRLPSTTTLHKSPREIDPALWIANLPEKDFN